MPPPAPRRASARSASRLRPLRVALALAPRSPCSGNRRAGAVQLWCVSANGAKCRLRCRQSLPPAGQARPGKDLRASAVW